MWVRLPEGSQGGAVSSSTAAARYGVAFRDGPRYFVNGGGGDHLGLSVMSVTLAQIHLGLQRLAAYLRREHLRENSGQQHYSIDRHHGKPGD